MTAGTAKRFGIKTGEAVGKYCEVDEMDRRKAGCGCDAANVCEKCMATAARTSESRIRNPFDYFDMVCSLGEQQAKGVRNAYREGVDIGVRRAVKERLQRDVEGARRLQATICKSSPVRDVSQAEHIEAINREASKKRMIDWHASRRNIRVTAKCILGHNEVLTERQMTEARNIGVVFCSQCGNPMSVRKAEA
jgi:hypothetical protein